MPSPINTISRTRARAALSKLLSPTYATSQSTPDGTAEATLLIEAQEIASVDGRLHLQLWRYQAVNQLGDGWRIETHSSLRVICRGKPIELPVPERVIQGALFRNASPIIAALANPKLRLLAELGEHFGAFKALVEDLTVAAATGPAKKKSAATKTKPSGKGRPRV